MLTLPGLAFVPPPITAILLDVWWGLTNGLWKFTALKAYQM